ncbi:MAG: hypothetical protein CSA29_03980 [Desulfobacterales bacterium]|nr:MAG: hypothetical protein CSA29_03980 [Desulfobacterales bacterium]
MVVAEFRFDWCESLVGRYLITTNIGRPEIGTIWESGRHTVTALQSIDDIFLEKENKAQLIRTARSFSELADGLHAGQWVNLDKARFKSLYLSLTPARQREIIQPARLLWLLNTNQTARIFCEGRPGGILVYFADSENRVIHQFDLNTHRKYASDGFFSGALEMLEGFAGNIYGVDRFFEAVFRLPPEIIPELIPNSDTLLSQSGTIDRVGIGNAAEEGVIRIGFEFSHLGERRVVTTRAQEWAVWQLNLILKGTGH